MGPKAGSANRLDLRDQQCDCQHPDADGDLVCLFTVLLGWRISRRIGEFDHCDRTAGFVGLAGRCVVYLADENDEEDQCQSDSGSADQYVDAYGSGHAGDLCFLRLGVCRGKRGCAVRVGGVVAGRGHDERTFGNGDRRCDCPRGRPGSAAANKREDEKASWAI